MLSSAVAFSAVRAPLAPEVSNAKSIFIVNQTGSQSVTDIAYGEFQQWGRFAIVDRKDAADLVALFMVETTYQNGTPVKMVIMRIFGKTSEDALFQASHQWALLANGPKHCVSEFKKRVQ